ncbi:uncharacterized protein LOC129720100 [Wyeomyia smithii]|uniref:uncharacterized protein LOC129720100 n=1 Tax=Wyeomyia smithii TaxID=174621 RepID=UPI002467ED55|nr:uncharacterized protein LOC129720100 [Wyeomyia smithii]
MAAERRLKTLVRRGTRCQRSASASYVDSLFDFPLLKRECASELSSLVDKFEANVKVLQQLGEKVQFWDILLIRMLSSRLDSKTRRDWEEYASTKDPLSFRDLTALIQRRVTVLQNIQGNPTESQPTNLVRKPPQRATVSHAATQPELRKCIICHDHRPLYMCTTFSKLCPEDKEKEVRRHRLCRNCLRKGHLVAECPSNSTCRKCRGRHHTQLCIDKVKTHAPIKAESNARVLISTPSTSYQSTSAVSASISEPSSYASRIKAQRKKVHLPIAGIGQSSAHARQTLLTTVRSRFGKYTYTLDFLVLPKVTIDLPSASVDVSSWEIPPGVQLADPSFHRTTPVDLVLGAEIFFDLFKVAGRIPLGEDLPVLVNFVFGWVMSGKSTLNRRTAPVTANFATTHNLQALMEKFWSIEEDDTDPCYSVEEAACEEHFRQTVTRNADGRYVVRLPLKQDILSKLNDNRRSALHRFHQLEARLVRNPDLQHQYRAFVEEYHALGHMQRVSDYEDPPTPCYHLPHHAVVREDSTTTKLRVVFDASCKIPNGPSLNDALMVGPTVQEDLRSIIMRSRTHQVMLIADSKQMYRQVLVDDRDTPLQRIVGRPSPDSPTETYELKTVTYGTASAPFLATRILQQLADDECNEFPEAAKVLRKDFYVDDLFSGSSDASNEAAVLEDVQPAERGLQESFDFDKDQCIKTLGLHWEPSSDQLRYKIHPVNTSADSLISKRIALSYIAKLFDPLGLVGPVVTTAKIFMQTLWTLKDDDGNPWDWDSDLPPAIKDRWHAYQSQLTLLNKLRIGRCILLPNSTSMLLYFSDASEHAYGACVYIRSTDADGNVEVSLLTAKSKVASLKTKTSIPRLELCGAKSSAELYKRVKLSLGIEAESFFWVDSTIVLCWLNAAPSTWTTFVANRVSLIQNATQNCSWNHVAGQENPADISRGIPAETLLKCDLWWHGPQWLKRDRCEWPIQPFHDSSQSPEVTVEQRKTPAAVISATIEPSFVDQLMSMP